MQLELLMVEYRELAAFTHNLAKKTPKGAPREPRDAENGEVFLLSTDHTKNNVKASENTGQSPSEPKHRKVGITETAFRDAHQSIMATRLRTEDMLPIAEAMDEVGIPLHGGMGRGHLRHLYAVPGSVPLGAAPADPEAHEKTKLQMLLRGQTWWDTVTTQMTWYGSL